MHGNLTDEQNRIHDFILDWYANGTTDFLTIGGYAGTGKTHLAACLRDTLAQKYPNKDVAMCCFTGKASLVLKSRLEGMGYLQPDDYVGTIHSLIYYPIYDGPRIVGWKRRTQIDYDLIMTDEASMVGESLWGDLSYYGKPIVAIGDHGQLPPVGDNEHTLMRHPEFVLKEIHRQALDSPIISLSAIVRKFGFIPDEFMGTPDGKITKFPDREDFWKQFEEMPFQDPNSMILCGLNRHRVVLNKRVRALLGFDGELPKPGERVVFLKNNHATKVMNGNLATVVEFEPIKEIEDFPDIYKATFKLDWKNGKDKIYTTLVHSSSLMQEKYKGCYPEVSRKATEELLEIYDDIPAVDLVDFAYVMSVHRSQGSEWDQVMLIDDFWGKKWDRKTYRRWLYTGLTRAMDKLYLADEKVLK